MEQRHRNPNTPEQLSSDRGRHAQSPTQIPSSGWKDIAIRVKDNLSTHQVTTLAAGTAFYLLLGLIPGLAALISVYGLVANPADVEAQFAQTSQFLPSDVRHILEQQMTSIAGQHSTAGWATLISILLALWSASAGMKTLMASLNTTYGEEEKRSYLKSTLVALGLTVGAIVVGAIAIGLIVALPAVLAHLGLGATAKTLGSTLRWPLLFVIVILALGVVYRYGPSRDEPQWKWVSTGALLATLLWLGGSALFSFYASHFGNYNKTYGSLSAVIVLMMWLFISAFVVLLGAEVNAEMEHQTAHDTTRGRPEQLGRRGAHVADTLGEEHPESQ